MSSPSNPINSQLARRNWSGNYEYSASALAVPRSAEETQALVAGHEKVKALGSRHSFNGIADTTGVQISLENLDEITVDYQTHTVTVGAGVSYSRLSLLLHQSGYALHNLASLPHISVVGGCATATHGSGNQNGSLATSVCAMDLITADGELRRFSRQADGDRFNGFAVHLGALGIITSITLHLEPAFQIRQLVYENLSFNEFKRHLDEIFTAAYSVSLFTDWQNHRATQAWIKRRATQSDQFTPASEFFGAHLASRKCHPIAGHGAEHCTDQLEPGPWYDRLPHFRMNFTPSSGNELQSEYFVDRKHGYEAILAVEELRDEIAPLLLISELRTIDSDDLWMSPYYQRPSLGFHFTWKSDWPAVKRVLLLIEEQLAPFGATPHWGKLSALPPAAFASLHKRLPEFQALARTLDPQGKFRNRFIDDLFSTS